MPGRWEPISRVSIPSTMRVCGFGLTHAGNNEWADSSRPTGDPAVEHQGLSPLGMQAVAKLNELGIVIDVSQLTPQGLQQVVALSKAPVIASHSDVRAHRLHREAHWGRSCRQ